MSSLRRLFPVLCLLLLVPGLGAEERERKWSLWRPIDEQFPGVRMRTSYEDNEGRGWSDGTHRWLIEVKNTAKRGTVKVALGFATWNLRTRVWDPPSDARQPSVKFELEPGDVHEGMAIGSARVGFDYLYSITLLGEGGGAMRSVRGAANSRIETKLIAESSLITQRVTAAARAPEERISRESSPAPAPVPAAPPVVAAKPVAPASMPAAILPMTAPALPPAATDGLDATGKFALWARRAQQGDAESMFELGRACRFGQGTTQDQVAATEWYRQAASRGHAGAMNKLAYAYNAGLGVERNEALAVEWWQKAAAAGEPDAIKKLASLGLAP